jgi:hypothetical protein
MIHSKNNLYTDLKIHLNKMILGGGLLSHLCVLELLGGLAQSRNVKFIILFFFELIW